jgi:alpha,alpha-trehalase
MSVAIPPVPGFFIAALLFSQLASPPASAQAPQSSTDAQELRAPSQLYGELFERVQMERVFEDGKTFVDTTARSDPATIVAEYQRSRTQPGFDLRAFVTSHFILPETVATGFVADPARDVRDHIGALWDVLTREQDRGNPRSSLLSLPHRYVVPGGRFREIYYWDSYFTMLGLEQSGRHDLVTDMVRNFAALIDGHGHIPNGNRTYYLSRSQPPFFAAMVNLVAAHDGDAVLGTHLPQLEREYAFWMEGSERLAPGSAHRRVVRLRDGTLFNRYWDDRAVPRDESYREDVETARASGRAPAEVYRNLRAAAESGWDFSSRWLEDGRTLATIRTVELVPVDLNSLLYHLEQTLARAYRIAGRDENARRLGANAWKRRVAMHRYLWNEKDGYFSDLAWREGKVQQRLTAAALYPLFFGIATREQAEQVATATRDILLEPDGLATTTENTGQQWDAPNGWAPLQWIAIRGLNDYGQAALAEEIARRWIRENLSVYRATGKLVEKYDVGGDDAARGGEYPLQDGFGWTNGVLRTLLALYPDAAEAEARPPQVRRAFRPRDAAVGRSGEVVTACYDSRPLALHSPPDPNAPWSDNTARLAGAFSVPSRQVAAHAAGVPAGPSSERGGAQRTLDSPGRQ